MQACAEFVKQRYGTKEDIVNLKWLLIDVRIELLILSIVYNGLTKENIPKQLQFVLKKPTVVLRQNSPKTKAKNLTSQLFIEEANKIFKNLPNNIKQEMYPMSYHSFQEKLRKCMSDKIRAKLLFSPFLSFCLFVCFCVICCNFNFRRTTMLLDELKYKND